jgi:hypothetical protein
VAATLPPEPIFLTALSFLELANSTLCGVRNVVDFNTRKSSVVC